MSFRRANFIVLLRVALVAACLLAPVGAALAQSYRLPDEVKNGLKVEDKLGAQLPMDAVFTDQDGAQRKLGEFFTDGKPKILLLVYYRCKMLCNITLNSATKELARLEWTAGNQYDILTISIDPLETSDLARDKRANYLQTYGREGAGSGWTWMTGKEADIKRLAGTVGFHYYWNDAQQEYAHPSTMFFISPKGVLTASLPGTAPDVGIRQMLFEAADGKIGTVGEQLLLRCFHFDPSTGKLTARLMVIVRVLSALLALAVGGMIGFLRLQEYRRARLAAGFNAAGAAEITAGAQPQGK